LRNDDNRRTKQEQRQLADYVLQGGGNHSKPSAEANLFDYVEVRRSSFYEVKKLRIKREIRRLELFSKLFARPVSECCSPDCFAVYCPPQDAANIISAADAVKSIFFIFGSVLNDEL